jgi:hypothetical protein
VLEVLLLCSDGDCAEERQVLVSSLEDLDGIGCECGFGLVLLRVAEVELV